MNAAGSRFIAVRELSLRCGRSGGDRRYRIRCRLLLICVLYVPEGSAWPSFCSPRFRVLFRYGIPHTSTDVPACDRRGRSPDGASSDSTCLAFSMIFALEFPRMLPGVDKSWGIRRMNFVLRGRRSIKRAASAALSLHLL